MISINSVRAKTYVVDTYQVFDIFEMLQYSIKVVVKIIRCKGCVRSRFNVAPRWSSVRSGCEYSLCRVVHLSKRSKKLFSIKSGDWSVIG